jgi:hypothetical protein
MHRRDCLRLLIGGAVANLVSTGLFSADAPEASFSVDPRVELFSILFRLAGHPEYNQAKVHYYAASVDDHFRGFRNHSAVRMARDLRSRAGISYNAPMDLALHTAEEISLKPRLPLSPKPPGLDPRWTSKDAASFLTLGRAFVRDTGYTSFLEQHREMHRDSARKLARVVRSQGHLEWFDEFFGKRQKNSFAVIAAPLNGNACYGTTVIFPDREELYSILGVWRTNQKGHPDFDSSVLPTVIHEFCHSYVNPLVNRHNATLQSAGKTIFPHVADAMARQAYTNWNIVMRESVVRACTIRHTRKYFGSAAAKKQIRSDEEKHFLWIEGLSRLVGVYEQNRRSYPDFDSFFSEVEHFFDKWAKRF